jgi:hypothetical protein
MSWIVLNLCDYQWWPSAVVGWILCIAQSIIWSQREHLGASTKNCGCYRYYKQYLRLGKLPIEVLDFPLNGSEMTMTQDSSASNAVLSRSTRIAFSTSLS